MKIYNFERKPTEKKEISARIHMGNQMATIYGYEESLDGSMNLVLIHKENGPAIIYDDGTKEWWFKNKKVECTSQEEFERVLKLKVFW